MKKYIFILMAVVVGVSACNKEELVLGITQTGLVNESDLMASSQGTPSYVYNSENPYDEMGILHNSGMKSIATPQLFNAEYSQQEYISNMAQFLDNNNLDGAYFGDNFSTFKQESRILQSFIIESTIQEYLESLESRGLISDLMAGYAIKLSDEVDRVGEYLKEKNGSMVDAYKKLSSNIKIIESQIISESNFDNANQKMMLLSMASIYRFSMYNYMEIVLEDSNPLESIIEQESDTVFHDDPEGDMGGIMIIGADWARIGHADAAGGLGGLAATGVSAFFIEVTWPIVAAAGLGGAVGNSVVELYNQVIDGTAWIIFWP
jgi:hypothetical protein